MQKRYFPSSQTCAWAQFRQDFRGLFFNYPCAFRG
jgi:hypothetical protein